MSKQLKNKTIINILNSTMNSLPTPPNLSYMWNWGSILGLCLMIQLVSGVLLASSFSPSMSSSFDMVLKTSENLDAAWMIRYVHANGASLFFVSMYIHIARGIYNSSYIFSHTWLIGVSILLATMATAFMGYVLPMNQMSFWGVSVITNLFSEIPVIGPEVVRTIWGGDSVNNPTIVRFFTFHFMLPFIIAALVIIHITYLHTSGSSNKLGVKSTNKLVFNPFFKTKDILGFLIVLFLFMSLCFYNPLMLGDDENFAKADPLTTPRHIQPEWYFLFAYAILRSIPNKLGGVIALAMSVLIFYLLPLINKEVKIKSMNMSTVKKVNFILFLNIVILLTWIGMRPVEEPYILTGQILTILYFMNFIMYPFTMSN